MLLTWNNTGGAGGISVPWSSTPSALLPPGFSLTRASTGTYFDSAGLLQTAAINAARGTYRYNGSSWVFDGTIVEAAATNNCLQSADFTTTWTAPVGATVTANQYTAPDGTTTMDRLNVSAGNTQHYLQQTNTATSAGANTVSVYAKYDNHQWLNISLSDGTNVPAGTFDLLNGVVGSTGYVIGSGTVSSRMTPIGGGVYRCELTGTVLANAASSVFIAANNSSTIGVQTWNAAGTERIGLWGAQLEFSGAATSYIPTTTAPVARSADVDSGATSGLLSSSAGLSVISFRPITAPSTGNIIAATNLPMSLNSGQLSLNDGTAARDFLAASLTVGTVAKLATTWGGTTCNGAFNGTVGTQRTFDGDMGLGATITLMGGVSGVLQSLRLGTRQATDSELAGWTT